MQPEEQNRKWTLTHPGVRKVDFADEEWMRLSALRQRIVSSIEYRERGVERYELEFAHWLVQHGKLSEG